MHEPNRELKAAREVIKVIDERWDAQRSERTLSALHGKRRRKQRRLRTLAGAGALCALGAIAFAAWRPTTQLAPQPTAAKPDALHMRLADGSEVWLRDAATRLALDEGSAQRVEVALLAGEARFEVVHRAERVFRVNSGDVSVEVLGTLFELERQADRTRVAVLRGRVAVLWPSGRSELSAGEAGWFPRPAEQLGAPNTQLNAPAAQPNLAEGPLDTPPAQPAGQATAPATQHNAPAAQRNPPDAQLDAAAHVARHAVHKPSASGAPSAWREPAEQGDFERAYELLARAPQPVADNVEELLLAADSARLSGHAAAALPFLKRVVAQHAEDSRAPLAAFTLGGVLMQQLGQPREAEAAYARARELSLNSSLAEDALARQVEATYRAGDTARARTLAREYLARYPKGRRVHAVQRFGGLLP
jgi:transmembrane sensor